MHAWNRFILYLTYFHKTIKSDVFLASIIKTRELEGRADLSLLEAELPPLLPQSTPGTGQLLQPASRLSVQRPPKGRLGEATPCAASGTLFQDFRKGPRGMEWVSRPVVLNLQNSPGQVGKQRLSEAQPRDLWSVCRKAQESAFSMCIPREASRSAGSGVGKLRSMGQVWLAACILHEDWLEHNDVSLRIVLRLF